jgi:acetolactate synthase-1/2/3 large subunit
LATGIACAYYDSTPCLFITGQVGMFHSKANRAVRQRGFQETDVVSMMKPITKYAVLLDRAEDARYVFEKALYLAKSGRPGPVLIDVPYNVQRAMIDPEKLRTFIPEEDSSGSILINEGVIHNIFNDLEEKERPIILIGGGVHISNQAEKVRELVSKLQIPVVATWPAVDIFEIENPMYIGNIGRAGNKSANRAIRSSDLVIALGTRFATKAIIDEKNFAKDAKIIAIDIDSGELNDGLIVPQVKICCDLKELLPRLLKMADEVNLPPKVEWLKSVAKTKAQHLKNNTTPPGTVYVDPYEFTEKLSKVLDSNTIIVGDTGTNLCWFTQAYQAKFGQRFISSWGNSPMGYALPASIGAYLAKRDATIVSISGDGGVQMNIQEFQTIALHKLPIKIFILNNNCYANVKFPAIEQFQ